MADYALKLIPQDHTFTPDFLKARQGVDLLKTLLPQDAEGNRIRFVIHPNPTLVDCGQNLHRIACPFCHEEMGTRWWQDAVSDAFREDFWVLHVTMPCCAKEASLNTLEYTLHVGFARFVLEISHPVSEVPENLAEMVSALYGQPFHLVHVRP